MSFVGIFFRWHWVRFGYKNIDHLEDNAKCEFVYCVVDTVKSSRDSPKTLLTLFFTREKLFPAFLINRCTKGSVRLVFDNLEKEWEPMNLIFKVFLQYL